MSRPVAFVHGAFGRIGLVDMDSDLAVHAHPHLHVVVKAGGADTTFRVRDRVRPVTDETAVLVNAWEPHAWRRAAGAAPTRFLTFYLEPDWLAAAGLEAASDRVASVFDASGAHLSASALRTIRVIGDLMQATARASASGAPCAALGAQAAEFVPGLVDELRAAAVRDAGETRRHIAVDYRIRRALDLLRAPDGPRRVDAVAREVGLSRPRFFELFLEGTGLTPGRVANAARMERAIGLLTGSQGRLGDLATDLGFATQGNFTRFFRQQLGVTPRSFRRSLIRLGPLACPHGRYQSLS